MIHAGVRDLKNHLSHYLRQVRAGERVVVTHRGRPVAALVGLERSCSETAWNLVRLGVGDWGGGKPKGLLRAPRVPGRQAGEVVIEDRR